MQDDSSRHWPIRTAQRVTSTMAAERFTALLILWNVSCVQYELDRMTGRRHRLKLCLQRTRCRNMPQHVATCREFPHDLKSHGTSPIAGL